MATFNLTTVWKTADALEGEIKSAFEELLAGLAVKLEGKLEHISSTITSDAGTRPVVPTPAPVVTVPPPAPAAPVGPPPTDTPTPDPVPPTVTAPADTTSSDTPPSDDPTASSTNITGTVDLTSTPEA
jgi:hypothetical protein